MDTVSQVVEAFGGTAKVAKHCSIGAPAVSGWIAAGKFPPGRLLQLEELAAEHGVAIPRALFGFAEKPAAHVGSEAA